MTHRAAESAALAIIKFFERRENLPPNNILPFFGGMEQGKTERVYT